jgi:hypothetical protein
MGTSTAGIAHAAIAGHICSACPWATSGASAKDHGRKNQIEGKLEPGQKVVVVEDLISTGGSVIEVVDVLRDAGAEVLGVVEHLHLRHEKGTPTGWPRQRSKTTASPNFRRGGGGRPRGWAISKPGGRAPAAGFRTTPRTNPGLAQERKHKNEKSHRHPRPFAGGDRLPSIATANDIIANPAYSEKCRGKEAGHPVFRALHPHPPQL